MRRLELGRFVRCALGSILCACSSSASTAFSHAFAIEVLDMDPTHVDAAFDYRLAIIEIRSIETIGLDSVKWGTDLFCAKVRGLNTRP